MSDEPTDAPIRLGPRPSQRWPGLSGFDLRVYRDDGRAMRFLGLDQPLPKSIPCGNERCRGGGYEVLPIVDEASRARDRETMKSVACPGEEPLGALGSRSCGRVATVDLRISFAGEGAPVGAPAALRARNPEDLLIPAITSANALAWLRGDDRAAVLSLALRVFLSRAADRPGAWVIRIHDLSSYESSAISEAVAKALSPAVATNLGRFQRTLVHFDRGSVALHLDSRAAAAQRVTPGTIVGAMLYPAESLDVQGMLRDLRRRQARYVILAGKPCPDPPWVAAEGPDDFRLE